MDSENTVTNTKSTIPTQHRSTDMNIKILQINVQRSRAASSNVIKTANDLVIDIITIQEPHTINNKIVRFNNWRVITKNNNSKPKCGIIVKNKTIDIALVLQLSNKIITTVIINQEEPIYLLSIYLSPYLEDRECIDELDKILKNIKGKNIIITGDANAKSATWYHPQEDERGRLLNGLMDEMDMVSSNMSTLPTFFTGFEEGWTDIFINTNDLSHKIRNCETLLRTSASDHRYILAEIQVKQKKDQHQWTSRTHINWELFKQKFAGKVENIRL
ncbi:uncharacterized protein [Centruroides vittatus]|uniref:uncharacterized protein n=1 Tax=Centruroides vittatus TaxID=120091 RepID=UPI00351003DF